MKTSTRKIAIIGVSIGACILFGVFSLFGSLTAFFPHIPSLVFGENTYLVVFQNNTELRPTGGFISQYALLRINNGVPHLEFRDVYGDIARYIALKAPYPHEELLKNRWYEGYTFRDANWNPDFAQTSNDLISFYNQTYQDQIDGVIAVNFSVIDGIISDLGGIDIDGIQYRPEQLFEFLEHSVSNIDKHNVEALSERKSVLGTIKNSLVKRMLNPLVLRIVNRRIVSSLEHKEIQLYFTDENLQQFAENQGWAGRLPTNIVGKDFLYVNDANLGGAKSNRYIYKTIDYNWKAQEGRIDGKLNIHYQHFGKFNAPLNTGYSGYTRIYIPGSAMVSQLTIDGQPVDYTTETIGPFIAIGFILKLPLDSESTVKMTYTQPMPSSDQYALQLLKQSGDDHTHITVTGALADGTTVVSDDFISTENIARYSQPLEKDRVLTLHTLADQLSPRVVYQKIRDLQTIDIHFNEAVAPRNAQNGFNYEIVDQNVANQSTDVVKIVNVEQFDRFVTLTVSGMTEQPEEHYLVIMRTLSDLAGNAVDPNPKTITLVQRIGEED